MSGKLPREGLRRGDIVAYALSYTAGVIGCVGRVERTDGTQIMLTNLATNEVADLPRRMLVKIKMFNGQSLREVKPKQGRRPAPLGTTRIVMQGKPSRPTRMIKVRHRRNGKPEKWERYSLWWWKKHQGVIPKGYRVYHVDGNLLNDTPENYGLATPGQILASKAKAKKLPLGTIRWWRKGNDKPKQAWVRVALIGPDHKQWMLYSIWWWTENVGPIPEGKMVYHKDFDLSNINPDNFVLRTRSEHLREYYKVHPHQPGGWADSARLRSRILRATSFLVKSWYAVDHAKKTIYGGPRLTAVEIYKEWDCKKGHPITAIEGRNLRDPQYKTYKRRDEYNIKCKAIGSAKVSRRMFAKAS